jgi:hypothetical protein
MVLIILQDWIFLDKNVVVFLGNDDTFLNTCRCVCGEKYFEERDMEKVLHGIAVVIGFIVWRVSGHILIGAVVGFVAEGLILGIGGALKQQIQKKQLESMKCPDFYYIGGNLKDQKETSGLRIFFGLPENGSIDTVLLKAAYQEGLEAYYKSDNTFRLCYNAFAGENLPVGIYAVKCIGNDLVVQKAAAAWQAFLHNLFFEMDLNQDMLAYDFTFTPPGNGLSQRYGLVFLFDKSLFGKKVSSPPPENIPSVEFEFLSEPMPLPEIK